MSYFKRFIHFGCWNNSGGDYKNLNKKINAKDTALTRVMKQIKKNVDNNALKPEFISVAGDNYYPILHIENNKIKSKTLDEDDLISGFKCLPKNVDKYILLGNHDLEEISNRKEESKTVCDSTNILCETSECQILDMQTEIASDKKSHYKMDNLKNKYIMNTKLSDSTIVIMLDTSMYSNAGKHLKQVTACYQHLFEIHGLEKIDDLNAIEKVRELQKSRVEAFVKDKLIPKLDKIKNIIVIGHHPLICFKTDKVNETETLSMNELNNFYYYSIYNKLKKNKGINYFYLCADLHQYQTGDIHITKKGADNGLFIRQYIAGTGGSKLEKVEVDLSCVKKKNQIKKVDSITITYTNVYNLPTYGFLDCILTPEGDFNPIFIKADMRKFTNKTFKKNLLKKGSTKKLRKGSTKKLRKGMRKG